MSGDGKRGGAQAPVLAPILDSTNSSPSETALHADVLILVESGRDLVCTYRTRSHRARGVHFGQGSGEENHALYPSLLERRSPYSMEILRCHSENQSMLTNSLRQATSVKQKFGQRADLDVVASL